MLEDNIQNLRNSLRHWQTWEAEYEGLKEEILAANPSPNRTQLEILAFEYEGDLVNRKEIQEILGPTSRTASQTVNILDRRIDYVEQNVKTVQKQLEVAENKLAAATIISEPDVRNEEGLPLTEIIEELDEEGNIISSHTSTPGSAKPQLLEVLQKAGVRDLPMPENSSGSKFSSPHGSTTEETTTNNAARLSPVVKSTKKGVKFTDDTKPGPHIENSRTANRIANIMSIAKRSEEQASEPAVIPDNESPEDAALRREMLQYGMSEIGAVVAELDIEEESDWSNGDFDDTMSSTDDEDQFGRSTGKLVDDELREQMMELERRLGVKMMQNVGKTFVESDVVREGIGRVMISRQDDPISSKGSATESKDQSATTTISAKKEIAKKAVRFSEDLDISSAPHQPSAAVTAATESLNAAPVREIIERTAPKEAMPLSQKKISRFKSDRAAASKVPKGFLPTSTTQSDLSLHSQQTKSSIRNSSQTAMLTIGEAARFAPSGPKGMTLASTVIEHDTPSDVIAVEPDELDPQLLHQEVATEYHRMRNRMIHRQGGFTKEDESEIVPFAEGEGGPKKMSRFKAARLARP